MVPGVLAAWGGGAGGGKGRAASIPPRYPARVQSMPRSCGSITRVTSMGAALLAATATASSCGPSSAASHHGAAAAARVRAHCPASVAVGFGACVGVPLELPEGGLAQASRLAIMGALTSSPCRVPHPALPHPCSPARRLANTIAAAVVAMVWCCAQLLDAHVDGALDLRRLLRTRQKTLSR